MDRDEVDRFLNRSQADRYREILQVLADNPVIGSGTRRADADQEYVREDLQFEMEEEETPLIRRSSTVETTTTTTEAPRLQTGEGEK
jgi:hypothetical protein